MAVFKCKMCGGTLEVQPGESVAVCDSCGSKQTIPNLSDDRKANLFDRANHFRRANEFDKAMNLYEQILNEDNSDAEAHWGVVLCRYGIEYVEDPATHKRMPTVNRAQYSSILADEDYKAAMQYADGYQRDVYESEAKEIETIQKGILAISQKEEPFDVFISFKETDANGRRTPDAVLANELYHQLTQEGFKVFFAPITLEDKLGTEYEPYIFAALNSSKAMVVLGTKPEYFNAVWVKNEWSRFLALIRNGAKKTLIPAYRDMDPYDLPDEFSHLMAQDMSKLGFMQDLIRGIKKIVVSDAPKTTKKDTVSDNIGNGNASSSTEPLLERAFLFLEDGKWQDADSYCEKVLDIEPKNAVAYLGKLMAELHVNSREQLANCVQPFDNRDNYIKIIRFGNEKLENEIRGYISCINDRNESSRQTGIYNSAISKMRTADTENAFRSAAEVFATIPGFKDADNLCTQCLEKAEICRKDAIYASANEEMDYDDIYGLQDAIDTLKTIYGYKDTNKLIWDCQRRIEEIKANEETKRLEEERIEEQKRIAVEKAKQKIIKLIKIVSPIVVVCVSFSILLVKVTIPNVKYNTAVSLMGNGEYDEAIIAFNAMDGYKDSNKLKLACQNALKDIAYNSAVSLMNECKYSEAIDAFRAMNGYKDSEAQISFCQMTLKDIDYNCAVDLMNNQKYTEAITIFESLDYKDSEVLTKECRYQKAEELFNSGKYPDANAEYVILANTSSAYLDSAEKMIKTSLLVASELYENGKNEDALILLSNPTLTSNVNYYKKNGKDSKSEGIQEAIKNSEEIIKLTSSVYDSLAREAYDKKDYKNAVELYENVINYNAKEPFYIESNYFCGLESQTQKNYHTAIEFFEKAGTYEDSKAKRQECMYDYALLRDNNYELTDITTYNYLVELKKNNYKDAKDIYESFYKISATVSIGTYSDKSLATMKSTETPNTHIHVTGGPPVPFKIITKVYSADGSSGGSTDEVMVGNHISYSWTHSSGKQPIGIFGCKVFDDKNNLIGEASIKVEQ